jgi:site-specific DNA-methyltransferase (adenine-specific)
MTDKKYILHRGDVLDILPTIQDNSVDSIVTDPPYELGFMGKSWDASGIAYNVDMWREALRVLKPGGHLLAFSGSRTYHRMACAIEDGGFEIRDQIMWVYGSGYPKNRNLAKLDYVGTPHAEEWEGWGTGLKPAHEPICMARKPLVGTVAKNVLEFRTGALNIGACRVAPTGESREREGEASQERRYTDAGGTNFAAKPGIRGGSPDGRHPANLIHDGSAVVLAAFPEQSSVTGKRSDRSKAAEVDGTAWLTSNHQSIEYTDSGSPARFFYCAKASRTDRHDGLDNPGPQFKHGATLRQVENTNTKGNHHPTVKPTDLMAYLTRLVTPPGGRVLDLFFGSGSTGKACMREGFSFVGIDLDQDANGQPAGYLEIATARIEHELAKMSAATKPASTSWENEFFGTD